MTDLDRIRFWVTSWREHTELSAARCMYEIAKVLGVEPQKRVAGRVRGTARMDKPEHASSKCTRD